MATSPRLLSAAILPLLLRGPAGEFVDPLVDLAIGAVGAGGGPQGEVPSSSFRRDVGRNRSAGAGMNFSRGLIVTEEQSVGRAGVAVLGCPAGVGRFTEAIGPRSPALLVGQPLAPDSRSHLPVGEDPTLSGVVGRRGRPAPHPPRAGILVSGGSELIVIYGVAGLSGVGTQRPTLGRATQATIPGTFPWPAARPDNSAPSLLCGPGLWEQSSVDSRSCAHSRRIPKMEQCTPGRAPRAAAGSGPRKAGVWGCLCHRLSGWHFNGNPGWVGLCGGGARQKERKSRKPEYPVNNPGLLWLDAPGAQTPPSWGQANCGSQVSAGADRRRGRK